MNPIVLKHHDAKGPSYEATFLPAQGMNLISFKRGEVEVIDQATKASFEERFGGLGPLIGPHFHRRNPKVLPIIQNEALFPHIARCKAKGVLDPFSHGIARYAPWRVKFTENSFEGEISGKDLWNGVALSELEGQQFTMKFNANLNQFGLSLKLSVVSDTASVVGIHYYYRLPGGKGQVRARVRDQAYIGGVLKEIPKEWGFSQNELVFPLNQPIDATFFPFPSKLHGDIWLETEEYHLKTTYNCLCEENSWQLFHPEKSHYVCIEPISAQDPRHPNLSVSSMSIQLQVELPR